MNPTQTPPAVRLPDYSVVFSKLGDEGAKEEVAISRRVLEQAQNIEMIAQATEEIVAPYVTTFLSR